MRKIFLGARVSGDAESLPLCFLSLSLRSATTMTFSAQLLVKDEENPDCGTGCAQTKFPMRHSLDTMPFFYTEKKKIYFKSMLSNYKIMMLFVPKLYFLIVNGISL